jgi:hypothetical protein
MALDQKTLSTTSTQYVSSIHALRDLFSSCQITEIRSSLSRQSNGVEYSYVEITCDDGIQYGLQVYGKEAIDLNRIALENIPKVQISPMIVS